MFTLPDGSEVFMFSGASIEYATDFTIERNVILQGNAFFQVKPNEQRPFKIKTEQLDIEVLGTSFLVEQNQAFTDIGVVEGKVKVTSRDLEALLSVNDYARIAVQGSSIAQRDMGNPLFDEIPGLIVAANEPVISLLNRVLEKSGFTLTVESIPPDCKVKANFLNQSPDDIIEEISLICDFSYHKTDQAYVIE